MVSAYHCPFCGKTFSLQWRTGEAATAVTTCPNCRELLTAAAPYPQAQPDAAPQASSWESVATAVLGEGTPAGTAVLSNDGGDRCPFCQTAVVVAWDPRDRASKVVRCPACEAYFSVLDKSRNDPRNRKPGAGREQRPL